MQKIPRMMTFTEHQDTKKALNHLEHAIEAIEKLTALFQSYQLTIHADETQFIFFL